MKKIIKEIKAERRRQRKSEGWSLKHDDAHESGELAAAAACYAMPRKYPKSTVPRGWPWDEGWYKPHGRRRDLIRAAALIVAELERLDRKDKKR